MTKLRNTSSADRDISDQAVWLEQQQPGMGNEFLDAVESAAEEIARHPSSCPTLVMPGVELKVALRWLRAGKFSHLIVFEIAREECIVHGVLHPNRDIESILRIRIGVN